MSTGFSGDFFATGGGRSTTPTTPTNFTTNNAAANLNTTTTGSNLLGTPQQHMQQQRQQNHPFSFPSPILPDPIPQIHRPDFIGKRSLAEFQRQGLAFYLRNVKPRPANNIYQQHASPISPLPPVDISAIQQQQNYYRNSGYNNNNLPVLSLANNSISNNILPQFPGGGGGRVVVPRLDNNNNNNSSREFMDKNVMSQRLQQLEKQLLGDDDDETEENISVVTNSEWSETIQNLLSPTQNPPTVSLSPTSSSSSSSCSSTLASPPLTCLKQSLIDVAVAISENKQETVTEILTRLDRVASAKGNPEQRLACYMLSALKSRANPVENPPIVSELYGEEHVASTQMLYDVSPCFKLGFMAANLAILEATLESSGNSSSSKFDRIHVVDCDIGHGKQYVHLLHALSSARKTNSNDEKHVPSSLKLTTFSSSDRVTDERLNRVGVGLKSMAEKIGFPLEFQVMNLNPSNLTREALQVQPDEALVVNLAYKLYKLPDESVTTENLRDDLLRRVKSLSPLVVTVVEQELNSNTAPIVTRVRDACDYYGALFESLDATMTRDNAERVRIEMGLARRMCNSVACEGRERVERCEVYGKWRARMGMAGFKARPVNPNIGESLRSKLNSGTRGNPGFTVSDQVGGVCFGWKGRTLTFASTWQ